MRSILGGAGGGDDEYESIMFGSLTSDGKFDFLGDAGGGGRGGRERFRYEVVYRRRAWGRRRGGTGDWGAPCGGAR